MFVTYLDFQKDNFNCLSEVLKGQFTNKLISAKQWDYLFNICISVVCAILFLFCNVPKPLSLSQLIVKKEVNTL